MHIDPILPPLVTMAVAVVLVGQILKRFKQPYIIGYLLVGILMGPHGINLIKNVDTLAHVGSIGVVLLMFFVGMEISIPRLLAGWRTAVFGTLLQILASVAVTAILGVFLEWPYQKSILFGFIISLSSTAVVLKVFRDRGEQDTTVARSVTGILIAQDVAVIPMLVIIGLLHDGEIELTTVWHQVVGGCFLLFVLVTAAKRPHLHLPGTRYMADDHEMQVFVSLSLCFGMALLSAWLDLSSALGAFVAGVLVAKADETRWVKESLEPFHVVFVGLFFVSIGMLVDLHFVVDHLGRIAILVAAVFILNTLINAGALRLLGESWAESLHAAALLAQIGEFSFVLAAVGLGQGLIQSMGYHTTIAVIALSLCISPFWIGATRYALQRVTRVPADTPPGPS